MPVIRKAAVCHLLQRKLFHCLQGRNSRNAPAAPDFPDRKKERKSMILFKFQLDKTALAPDTFEK
jgi:hypothetical protein